MADWAAYRAIIALFPICGLNGDAEPNPYLSSRARSTWSHGTDDSPPSRFTRATCDVLALSPSHGIALSANGSTRTGF